jgi:hypothetical protein
MTTKYLEPSPKGMRQPLDDNRMNGPVVNIPRMAHLGGLDKIKETYGLYKNNMTIVKPGKSSK